MNIKERFLQLTSRTYPHGTEGELLHLLPDSLQKDEFDNLFIKIGLSDVMFTSHLDTATSALTDITHVIEDSLIKTDGTSILGADDKAGVVIMLHMIENKIPGLYYFFLGEEVGCIGSRKLKEKFNTDKLEGINKVISFDRRGTSSVITFQSSSRCCSDKFGEALSAQLNLHDSTFTYKTDPTGIYTDSAQFTKIYPECTNISVGYQNEHCFTEVQDIEHLEKLANACLLVDWKSLPVERDPSVTEYSSHGYGWGYDDDWYGGGGYWPGSYSPAVSKPSNIEYTEKEWFHDSKFNYVSSFERKRQGKKIVSVDLCEQRVRFEEVIIGDLLFSLELEYKSHIWDGFKLMVTYADGRSTMCDRNDIIEYLPEFNYSDEVSTFDRSMEIPTSDFKRIQEDEFLDKDIYD
jgi:hypothetical protein